MQIPIEFFLVVRNIGHGVLLDELAPFVSLLGAVQIQILAEIAHHGVK